MPSNSPLQVLRNNQAPRNSGAVYLDASGPLGHWVSFCNNLVTHCRRTGVEGRVRLASSPGLGWWQHSDILVPTGETVTLTPCPGWIPGLDSLGTGFTYQQGLPGGATSSDVVTVCLLLPRSHNIARYPTFWVIFPG